MMTKSHPVLVNEFRSLRQAPPGCPPRMFTVRVSLSNSTKPPCRNGWKEMAVVTTTGALSMPTRSGEVHVISCQLMAAIRVCTMFAAHLFSCTDAPTSLECGYSAASLRERIYASDSAHQAAATAPMAGVLIYTQPPTARNFGGLVALGNPQSSAIIYRLPSRSTTCVLRSALRRTYTGTK